MHYTKEPEQPWYSPKHPKKKLWEQYLVEAIEQGYVERGEIRYEIQKFKPHTRNQRGCGLHPYYQIYA